MGRFLLLCQITNFTSRKRPLHRIDLLCAQDKDWIWRTWLIRFRNHHELSSHMACGRQWQTQQSSEKKNSKWTKETEIAQKRNEFEEGTCILLHAIWQANWILPFYFIPTPPPLSFFPDKSHFFKHADCSTDVLKLSNFAFNFAA